MRVRGLGICMTVSWLVLCASCSRWLSVGKEKREANETAQKLWNSMTIKCGDSWFAQIGAEFFELRQFSYTVDADYLTDLEKLNGYEWKGTTRMHTKASRTYERGGLQDWKSGTLEFVMPMAKRNGRWEFGRSPFFIDAGKLPQNQLRCNQFPR